MQGENTQSKKEKTESMTLEEFEKIHSKPFIYILEQYEKWVELKGKASVQANR